MAQLAIAGHTTRGKEVIEILEMLGGSNKHNYSADCDSLCFYVGNENNVIYCDWVRCYEDKDTLVLTLEEFIKEFPYKVGDKVCFPDDLSTPFTINKMWWDENANELLCSFIEDDIEVPVVGIRTYKEETMEDKPNLLQQLKDYFNNTPREVIEKEWHEYDKYNDIGPSIEEYIKYVNSIRQPQYPKTYEECCKIKQSDPNFYIDTHLYSNQLGSLYKLIICRNAYWKLAGEQMGLGKPWEPDWSTEYEKKYVIEVYRNNVRKNSQGYSNTILAFPTAEMRDAFYENFKELIEECKELL